MINIEKTGKGYRVWESRTESEEYKKHHSVFLKAENSEQAERLVRKLLKAVADLN